MYKGYLDNLLIARYCRRFIDTDPTGSNDKTKGPMPVETAPTVSEFSFQQIRPKSDKQSSRPVSSRKQRAVTSTKYLPQLPRILKSGVQSVEPRAETDEFLETSMFAEEKTHSFLRFPRSGDESHDSFQGETSEQEQGNEFTRHDTTNDQEGDYNQEKQDGESDNFDSLDVNSKQDNNYGTHVKTQEQADTGRAKSKKNADSRKGNNNSAKIVGKSREQTSKPDEATSQSSDTRQTTRQTNSNKKYRKVEKNDSHFQHSKQTGRKGQRYTHANSNDASTSSTENNEEEKRPVNAQEDENQDYQGNDNPKENGKHRNEQQPRNDWFPLNNRRGGKYESNNTDKKRKVVTSRENRKEENGNTSRGYKKAGGKSEGMERFKRTDESEGNVKKSGRTSSNYERNGRRDVQKTHEYDSNIKKVVNINDDDELSDGNGKSKNNKQGNSAGYRKNDASEKPDSFDGYNKERDFNNERNNGFKSYSENTWKDDDNVDTYSIEKTKEEGEITDSNEDYDYSQQTKGGGHEVEKKRMGRTNRDTPHDKRKEKKKEGSRHVRGHTEQRQLYKGNAREKEVSNLGTQEKEPSESGVYFDSFEGNKKERYDSDFRSNAEPKLTSKMAAMNEDKYVKLGVSNTHDALEDRIWNNDKKFKDSEEEDSNVGQNLAKSRPIRHDRGGISKLDNQQIIAETSSGKETNFDTSSRETVSNLVKGRRRSGSKKKNWYDKTDVARSRHQESLNSDEQKPLVEQNKKPVSAQRAVDTENKRSGKVEIVYSDIHNIEYDQSITDDKHSDPPKSKNEKFDHQSIHTFDNPDNINFGKVLRKPAAHGFIVKDYIENYEEDDELDQRAQADDNGRVSHESTDKTTKSAKDPAQQASNSGQILPKSKNLEPVKTLTNDQKNKNTKGNEQVKDKGESHNEEKNTSLSTQKDEQEPAVASDNHFNMPVDVTKIASSISALVASNISQERTPNLADPTKQSPAPIETGKLLVH